MLLRFVAPTLASLDDIEAELLFCPVWSDVRPSHGTAGLCDFRMGGAISSLERRGLITGELGEVVLLPAKPKLSFERLVLFGSGPKAGFGESAFVSVVRRMLTTMDGFGARAGVVELPGRADALLPAEATADLLLAEAGRGRAHDVWFLVEGVEAQQRIGTHLADKRRRVRRAP
jgi:hypothetical protein